MNDLTASPAAAPPEALDDMSHYMRSIAKLRQALRDCAEALEEVRVLGMLGATLAILATMIALSGRGGLEGADNAPKVPHGLARYASNAENWSGYAAANAIPNPTNDSVWAVSGGWQVKALTCGFLETSSMASWVGIGGIVDQSLLQVGTYSRCTLGVASYGGWYELYPDPPIPLPVSIYAGDLVSASITSQTDTLKQVNLTNVTTTEASTVPFNRPAGSLMNTAEWITEAPGTQLGPLPLPNFGTQYWAYCEAIIRDPSTGILNNGSINTPARFYDSITMVKGGVTRARPSPLGAGGSSFSIRWLHS